MTNQLPTETAQCPACGSFAWSYDDTAIVTGPDGELLDADVCHCEDCDHMWPVATVELPDDEDIDTAEEFRSASPVPYVWLCDEFGEIVGMQHIGDLPTHHEAEGDHD